MPVRGCPMGSQDLSRPSDLLILVPRAGMCFLVVSPEQDHDPFRLHRKKDSQEQWLIFSGGQLWFSESAPQRSHGLANPEFVQALPQCLTETGSAHIAAFTRQDFGEGGVDNELHLSALAIQPSQKGH